MKIRTRCALAAGWLAVANSISFAEAPFIEMDTPPASAAPAASAPAALPPSAANSATVTTVAPVTSAPGNAAGCTSCATCGQPCCARGCDQVNYLFPQDGRFRVRGWLDGGKVYNYSNPRSHFNGPYNATDRDELVFNQAYGIVERTLPLNGCCGVGGRMDVMYGFDFNLAQSRGFELRPDGTNHWNGDYYGLSVPQLYGEVGSERLSMKAGHFYSIIGYESVMAPENFFYTHSYSYMFAGPFTHWGALATWKPNDRWTIESGVVNGWNALDREDDSPAYMGRIKFTGECNRWWTSLAVITGDDQATIPGILNREVTGNLTRYSYLLGVNPTKRLEYVFHQWLGAQEDGGRRGQTALWYGIDQYAYFKVRDCLKSGLRFEWFRDEDGTRVGLNRPNNPNKVPLPGNYFALTLGSNWNPLGMANVLIRPEIRWDWVTDTSRLRLPYSDGRKNNQILASADMMIKF